MAEERVQAEKTNAEFYLDLFHHDIGNIHQGIYGSLELMGHKLPSDDKKMRRSLEIAMGAVKRAIILSKEVNVLSMIRREKKNIHPIDLSVSITGALEQVKEAFPSKEIEADIDICPHEIMAEPIIQQLFFNLFHNGVKLQGDSPWIGAKMKKGPEGVRIIISDKGPGIPDDMKELMFEKHGMQTSATRTGLGLLIIRELVERYQGRIQIADRIEGDTSKGTSFLMDFN